LILLGKVADAGDVEDHDRVHRMLPHRAKRAVIHNLHQRKKPDPRRHKNDGRALPGKLRGPNDSGCENRRGDEGIRTQQNAEREQAERQCLDRHAQLGRAIGDDESKYGR
jgi:hypothetical protein